LKEVFVEENWRTQIDKTQKSSDIKQQISSSPQTNDNYVNSSLQKMTFVETRGAY